jgi:hypothetical protein
MIDEKINSIHTPCKDCVFAIYDNNTQTDCAINYIEKYKNKNVQILEAYDDAKEFYIINGKKCLGYRENKWFNQFGLSDADIQEKITKYFETNTLDYYIVIDLKNIDINNLDQILEQISKCKIQPKKVILIRYVDDELKLSYTNISTLFQKYNVGYVWRIQTIVDTTLNYEQILHNTISLNPKYRFICSITKYNENIEFMINKTNAIVHDDLDQFEIISNKDNSTLIFSTLVYRFDAFHGNNLLNNIDKYTII